MTSKELIDIILQGKNKTVKFKQSFNNGILNTIVHKDYTSQANIQIKIFEIALL
ncbi:MAG: hypothetical protein L3J74_13340 [Bacteroidales bacterium]|nr:hypothetical protein [Bacteroidales bacterium]